MVHFKPMAQWNRLPVLRPTMNTRVSHHQYHRTQAKAAKAFQSLFGDRGSI